MEEKCWDLKLKQWYKNSYSDLKFTLKIFLPLLLLYFPYMEKMYGIISFTAPYAMRKKALKIGSRAFKMQV